jgi:hypothetical protein
MLLVLGQTLEVLRVLRQLDLFRAPEERYLLLCELLESRITHLIITSNINSVVEKACALKMRLLFSCVEY